MTRQWNKPLGVRDRFFLSLILAGSAFLAGSPFSARPLPRAARPETDPSQADDFQAVVREVNAAFREQWS